MFACHGARVNSCDLDAAKGEAGVALTRPADAERLVANADGTRARGASAGGVTDSPKCVRMARIVAGSVVNAIGFISVPHCGKVGGKQFKIRPNSQAQCDETWWRGAPAIVAAASEPRVSIRTSLQRLRQRWQINHDNTQRKAIASTQAGILLAWNGGAGILALYWLRPSAVHLPVSGYFAFALPLLAAYLSFLFAQP